MQGYDAATYGDRFADVYDDWYPADEQTDALVAFVRERAERLAGPVLELGIGTGRVALPLAGAGLDVRGVDASAAMVARLHAKPGSATIAVTIGDMAAVEVPCRDGEEQPPPLALVCCLTNTFFGILEAVHQQACLRRVHDALAPGGLLVLGAFVPPDDVSSEPSDDAPAGGADAAGVTIRSMTVDTVVLSVARRDPDARRIEGHYIELTEHGNRLRPYVIRYASPAELDAMADAAGLELVERYADARGTPFDPASSPDHLSVYRRPSS